MKYLIDEIQAATFDKDEMRRSLVDAYEFRKVIRKAERFVVNKKTSALMSDFSLAVTKDIDAACTMAVPPYPVTWIEFDNAARLERTKTRGGVELAENKEFDKAEDQSAIERVGWLIQHGHDQLGTFSHRIKDKEFSLNVASYHAMLDGKWFTPNFSYVWSNDLDIKLPLVVNDKNFVDQYGFGMVTNCRRADIIRDTAGPWTKYEIGLLKELTGELRQIFGFLVALNSSGEAKSGISRSVIAGERSNDPEPIFNGKPLFHLEHKILKLELGKRQTVDKVVLRSITQAHKKGHDVRGHLRKLYNTDGTLKKVVPVKSHHRGDDRLGIIKKDYEVN